jgi:hypothetical protein
MEVSAPPNGLYFQATRKVELNLMVGKLLIEFVERLVQFCTVRSICAKGNAAWDSSDASTSEHGCHQTSQQPSGPLA